MENMTNLPSIASQYDSATREHLRIRNRLFLTGINNYDTVEIINFDKKMTSLQMKELYVTKGVINHDLSPLELGALYQHINLKIQEEHINYVLKQTETFSLLFSQNGCKNKRLIPQSFYLSLIGDKYSGRCYPLVRAMSVALASKGNTGANKFVDNLFLAAAAPESNNANLLKNALVNLHSNIDATLASKFVGNFNLREIKNLFYSGLLDNNVLFK